MSEEERPDDELDAEVDDELEDDDFDEEEEEDDGDDEDDDEDDEDDDDEDDDDDEHNRVAAATAKAVLEYVARSLVDDPDALEVVVDDSRRTIRLDVHAARDDVGRLIGRRGRIAGAIRTVVRAAAARDGVVVDVEFVD